MLLLYEQDSLLHNGRPASGLIYELATGQIDTVVTRCRCKVTCTPKSDDTPANALKTHSTKGRDRLCTVLWIRQ
jgi:hypothetical protein